jgi:hypothetical protein
MVSLSDLADGPKMLREAFGRRFGTAIWRILLCFVVLGILAVAATQITGLTQQVFGWPRSGSKENMPNQNCAVSGTTNYGNISQNCGSGH